MERSQAWAFTIADRVFTAIDTDHSGDISLDELARALRLESSEMDGARRFFARLDFDGDGCGARVRSCDS